MKLNTISTGTWNIISNYLNYNFNKLSVATGRLKGVSLVTFKGVYQTELELKTLHPNPEPGDYAFVIISDDSNTFSIYYADLNRGWLSDGGTYNPEVILKDYIEMSALSNIEDDLKGDIKEYKTHH